MVSALRVDHEQIALSSPLASSDGSPVQLELFPEATTDFGVREGSREKRAFPSARSAERRPLGAVFDADLEPLLFRAFVASPLVELRHFQNRASAPQAGGVRTTAPVIQILAREHWPLLDKELFSIFRNGGETPTERAVADSLYVCYLRRIFYIGDFLELSPEKAFRIGPRWAIGRIYHGLLSLTPAFRMHCVAPGWKGPHLRGSKRAPPAVVLPAHRQWWDDEHWLEQTLEDYLAGYSRGASGEAT